VEGFFLGGALRTWGTGTLPRASSFPRGWRARRWSWPRGP